MPLSFVNSADDRSDREVVTNSGCENDTGEGVKMLNEWDEWEE